MGIYVAKRVAMIAVILVIISGVIFVVTQALPGNVARMIAGQFASPDVIAAIQQKLGLNDSLLTQYWRWARGILSGDLGQSLIMERPIGPMLRDALANSALLASISIVTAILCLVVAVEAVYYRDVRARIRSTA